MIDFDKLDTDEVQDMFLSELSEGIEFDSEGYSKRCRSCRRKQARGFRIGCRAVCGPRTNENDEDEEYDFLEEEEGGKRCKRRRDCHNGKAVHRRCVRGRCIYGFEDIMEALAAE